MMIAKGVLHVNLNPSGHNPLPGFSLDQSTLNPPVGLQGICNPSAEEQLSLGTMHFTQDGISRKQEMSSRKERKEGYARIILDCGLFISPNWFAPLNSSYPPDARLAPIYSAGIQSPRCIVPTCTCGIKPCSYYPSCLGQNSIGGLSLWQRL